MAKKGFTTEKVVEELRGESRFILSSSNVEIRNPSPYYLRRVRRFLREIGERKLSEADISVLALALELKQPLVTDDFNLQNVALLMGIEVFDTGMGRIRELRTYKRVCTVCNEEREGYYCEICGSKTRVISLRAESGKR